MDNKEKYMISDDALSNVSGGTYLKDDPAMGPKCPYCFLQMKTTRRGYHCDSCKRNFNSNLEEITNDRAVVSNRAC